MPAVMTYRRRMIASIFCALVLAGGAACIAAERITEGIDRLIAYITVSPPSAQMPVGTSMQLSAVARDEAGDPVPNTPIQWSTTNASRATVNAVGLVTAHTEGGVDIVAAHDTFADTASLNITAAPAVSCSGTGTWSCEPSGMNLLIDHHFNTMEDGWSWQQKEWPGTGHIVVDPGAPLGDNVLELTFPQGFSSAGVSPGAMRPPVFPDPQGARAIDELYFGFYWKANPEWHSHSSGINKIAFGWYNNSGTFGWTWRWDNTGRKTIYMFSGGSGYYANTDDGFSVEPGNWYRIETHFRLSSAPGVADGQVMIWVNGVLHVDHRNVVTPTGYISDLYFDPTWGGVGGENKRSDDYFRISHVRVSAR